MTEGTAPAVPSLIYGGLAEWTGLEPATPGVTGRYSNQLNYHSNTSIARTDDSSDCWWC